MLGSGQSQAETLDRKKWFDRKSAGFVQHHTTRKTEKQGAL